MIEAAVAEIERAVVVAGSDGGDHGELAVAGEGGEPRGLLDELPPQAEVLRLLRGTLAEIRRRSVHVDLANHRAAAVRREREPQEGREPAPRRHELKEVLAPQRCVVVQRA